MTEKLSKVTTDAERLKNLNTKKVGMTEEL